MFDIFNDALLLCLWDPRYVVAMAEQTDKFNPIYYPHESLANDNFLALMGCPL